MRVYLAHLDGLVIPEEMPWILAEKYGWTLDYIDTLPMSKIHEFLSIQDGTVKADKSIIKVKK